MLKWLWVNLATETQANKNKQSQAFSPPTSSAVQDSMKTSYISPSSFSFCHSLLLSFPSFHICSSLSPLGWWQENYDNYWSQHGGQKLLHPPGCPNLYYGSDGLLCPSIRSPFGHIGWHLHKVCKHLGVLDVKLERVTIVRQKLIMMKQILLCFEYSICQSSVCNIQL